MTSDTQASTVRILVDIYRRMALIQRNDERFRAVIKAGKIVAPYYSPRGQEMHPGRGVGEPRPTSDYICTIYRGIHDMLAKGVPLEAAVGRDRRQGTGTCKGKGGPMHITHPRVRRDGHHRHRRQQHADRQRPGAGGADPRRASAWRWHTSATAPRNIGAFHEALNLASVWKLPVIFVCQNNGYGEHTRYELATSAQAHRRPRRRLQHARRHASTATTRWRCTRRPRGRGRPRPRRRGPDADRGEDLPLPRPRVRRRRRLHAPRARRRRRWRAIRCRASAPG